MSHTPTPCPYCGSLIHEQLEREKSELVAALKQCLSVIEYIGDEVLAEHIGMSTVELAVKDARSVLNVLSTEPPRAALAKVSK